MDQHMFRLLLCYQILFVNVVSTSTWELARDLNSTKVNTDLNIYLYKDIGTSGGSDGDYGNGSFDFDENLYYFASSGGIWNNSVDDCKVIFGPDAHLLSIDTEEEQLFINTWLETRVSGGGLLWTSGFYDTSLGEWVWAGSGDPVGEFTNWGEGEPTMPAGHRRIALRYINSAANWWETGDDTTVKQYVCEAPPLSSTTTTDHTDHTTPPTTTTPDPSIPLKCNVTNDLIIMLDSSTSVGKDNFQTLKEFCAVLAAAFTSKLESRVGFIVFSENVTTVVDLSEGLPPSQVSLRILFTNYTGGPTPTDLAIAEASRMFRQNYRQEPRSYLVITDGVSNNPDKTKEEADAAAAVGIRTFSLGLTSATDEDELVAIAGGKQENVFHAEEFLDVDKLLGVLSATLCPRELM